jgi:hypothetical protein
MPEGFGSFLHGLRALEVHQLEGAPPGQARGGLRSTASMTRAAVAGLLAAKGPAVGRGDREGARPLGVDGARAARPPRSAPDASSRDHLQEFVSAVSQPPGDHDHRAAVNAGQPSHGRGAALVRP